MLSHVQVAVLGADQAPTTLTGSCGDSPGLACRLVWDLSHDGRAAQVTSQFVAGPVHLLLRVIFVVLLALLIRFVVYRVINRLTERAARTLLPQFRNGAATSRIVRGGLDYRRRRGAAAAAGEQVTAAEAAAVAEANSSVPAEERGAADRGHGGALNGADSSPEMAAAAAQAERALIDERRKQRVRALGSVLRSAASVTIFSIAGVTILGDLGINLAPLLASAGVVGIAVGFGAQNLVRDYLSGDLHAGRGPVRGRGRDHGGRRHRDRGDGDAADHAAAFRERHRLAHPQRRHRDGGQRVPGLGARGARLPRAVHRRPDHDPGRCSRTPWRACGTSRSGAP